MFSRNVPVLPLAALTLLTIVTYAPVGQCDFINMDDPHYVTANEQVVQGLTAESIPWAFTTTHAGLWIPLTWLSLQLDATLFWPEYAPSRAEEARLAAWGFHWSNVLWHLANSLLVYRLVLSWSDSPAQSILTAALFAVHPLHVESVAWVTERKDLLSAFFGLAALLSYQRYADHRAARWYLITLLLFVLSLLSKAMLVTLPLLMLLLDAWPLRRFDQERPAWLLVEKVPLFAAAALITAITFVAQTSTGAVVSIARMPLSDRLANAVVSYAEYVKKTVWPVDFACYYPHPGSAWSGTDVLASAALMSALALMAYRLRATVPALALGLAWFAISLLPVIGLVQSGDIARADRFTYFPLIGLFFGIAQAASVLAERVRMRLSARVLVSCIVIALLAATTFRQVLLWRDSRTLYEHTLAITADNPYIEGLLGVFLYQEANEARSRLHTRELREEADVHLARSLELKPDNHPEVHFYRGLLLAEKRRWHEASEHLEKAVEHRPDWAAGHFHLGEALAQQVHDDAAVSRARTHLEFAARLDRYYAAPASHHLLLLQKSAKGPRS